MKYRTVLLGLFLTFQLFAQPEQKESIRLNHGEQQKPATISGILRMNLDEKMTAEQYIAVSKRTLGLKNEEGLAKISTQRSNTGILHLRYQLGKEGIPVEGSYLTLHEKNGQLLYVNGVLDVGIDLNTKPSISEKMALNQVLKQLNAKEYAWENPDMEADIKAANKNQGATFYPKGELLIIPDLPSSQYTLAYRFQVYSLKPHQHLAVYVDAHSGKIIRQKDLIRHSQTTCTGASNYNGNQSFSCKEIGNVYSLKNERIETREFASNNPWGKSIFNFSTNWTNHQNAIDVHWGTEQFVDFLQNELGRNGYDDDGGRVRALVNFPGNNAYWTGYAMAFGAGDGNTMTSLTSPDIVAHEYCHAMLDEIVGFNYAYESGAIEESYCDILGAIFEHHLLGNTDWVVGKEVTLNSQGFRNMGNPMVYQGPNWYNGSNDGGGVHTNSGVHNYWFYILTTGDHPDVSGIGFDLATQLMYETLFYLSPNADYIALRNASLTVAENLFGLGTATYLDVEAAWAVVGLDFSEMAELIDVQPSSGQVVYGGLPSPITWDTTGNSANVVLEYSINGGITWDGIVGSIGYKTGVYYWNVPQNYSNTALIRISDLDNLASRGQSESYFKIRPTINLPPIANDDSISTYQGFVKYVTPWNNDYDEAGGENLDLTLVNSIAIAEGELQVFPDGTLRIRAADDFLGTFSFRYQICDKGEPRLCDTARVSVNVAALPKPKLAMDDWGFLHVGDTLSDNLLQNDYNLDSTFSFGNWWYGNFQNGTISVQNDGEYTYAGNALGRDTIYYEVFNPLDPSERDTAALYLFTVENRCLAKDSMNLVVLYEMTDGINWDITWDLSLPVAQWYGVELSACMVLEINLPGNNLNGSIPDFYLPSLEDLRLNENYLISNIPDFNSTKLKYLDLSENQLSGSIPNFKIPELTGVYFKYNQFTGSIPDINLPNLKELHLSVNQLTGTVPNFDLPDLKELHLSKNQLRGSIPDFNLPNLTQLSLYTNQMTDTIPNFNLPNLDRLSLAVNQLTGNIPDFNLPNLTILSLDDNKLTDAIPGFNLPSLLILDLNSNELTGTIPNFNLPNLTQLDLGYNQLTGNLPNFIFPNLRGLYLSNNQLSGSIPDFNFPKLNQLNLNDNQLTGNIPNFNFPNLDLLCLYDNQLTGNIPNFNYPNLIRLGLNGNQLTGKIPDFSLPNLEQLYISLNNFNFSGIEQNYDLPLNQYDYYPQNNIPIYNINDSLFVNAGDTISENIYSWYRDGILEITINGQAKYQPQLLGNYHCSVTNPDVPDLILVSDVTFYEPPCPTASDLADNYSFCLGDTLSTRYANQLEYQWIKADSTLGDSASIQIWESGVYYLNMKNQCNIWLVDTTYITIDSTCVFPGDTNNDGIVNNHDLLPIGKSFGETGNARVNATSDWKGYEVPDWSSNQNNGLNRKYLDADGNGIINADDALVILQNYGKRHGIYKGAKNSLVSPLQLIPEITDIITGADGTEIKINLRLENSVDSLIQIYGLACQVNIVAPIFVAGNISLDNTEIANPAQQLLLFHQADSTNIVEMASTKTDLQDEIFEDSSVVVVGGLVTTQDNLPTGDSLTVITLFTENIQFTTMSGNFASGDFPTLASGGTATLYYTENLAYTLTSHPAHCEAHGSIEAQILRGTAPYSYLWSDGQITAHATGLSTGTHQVSISDAAGKSIVASATVKGIDPITANASLNLPTNGQANGSIELSVTGGTGNFTLLWNNGQTSPLATNLTNGSYAVLIEDEGGCVSAFSYDLPHDTISLTTKLFLEGPYDNLLNLMRDELRVDGLIPLTDPYLNLCTVSPQVFIDTSNNAIVDWLLVELREADNPSIKAYSLPALLQKDGDVVDIDGISPLKITGLVEELYYIAIFHRNHLPVMSQYPILNNGGILNHDFTTGDSYTNNLGMGQFNLTSGIWVLYSGDCNQSGEISGLDISLWNNQNGASSTYTPFDVNLNGDINGDDKTKLTRHNGVFSTIP